MNIGIDIGGSHIAIGLVDKNKIIEKKEINIMEKEKKCIKNFIEETIVKHINFLLREKKLYIGDINNIGIASPGTIISGEIITNATNLGIDNFNIVNVLKKYYKNTNIVVKNDAKCAGLAEKLYGNIKEYEDAIFICLGTGVGGAIFINGNLIESKMYSGFEIGHITINKTKDICKCGKVGCFDTYGSMKNFKEKIIKELKLSSNSMSFDIIPKLEKNKNTKIKKIIKEYINNLAIGISNLINIFEPEIIVLGGSFSYYQDILLEPLKEEILNNNMLFNKRKELNIQVSKFFNDAGIIGAGNL